MSQTLIDLRSDVLFDQDSSPDVLCFFLCVTNASLEAPLVHFLPGRSWEFVCHLVRKFISRKDKRILQSKFLVHKMYQWWSRVPCGGSRPQTVIKFIASVRSRRGHVTAEATQWEQSSSCCYFSNSLLCFLYRLVFTLIITAVKFVHLCRYDQTTGWCVWFVRISRHDVHCIAWWVVAMDAL